MSRNIQLLASMVRLMAPIQLSVLVACNDGTDPADDTDSDTEAPAPTFSGEVLPLLRQGCADQFCHGGVPFAGGLDLTDANAYNQLVGTASTTLPSMPRIAAGDPSNSWLIHKIAGTMSEVCDGGCGETMPPPYGMTQQQIDTITAWIEAGALND